MESMIQTGPWTCLSHLETVYEDVVETDVVEVGALDIAGGKLLLHQGNVLLGGKLAFVMQLHDIFVNSATYISLYIAIILVRTKCI